MQNIPRWESAILWKKKHLKQELSIDSSQSLPLYDIWLDFHVCFQFSNVTYTSHGEIMICAL